MNLWYENIYSRKQLVGEYGVDIYLRLSQYYSKREDCNSHNNTLYEYWYKQQSPVIKKIESILYARGHYKYEGARTMKDVLSKEGKQLHVDDIVSTADCAEGVIMSIITKDQIQINPIGKGLPFITEPANITIINSFMEKLDALATDQELMAILNSAEELAGRIGAPRAKTSKVKVEELEGDL